MPERFEGRILSIGVSCGSKGTKECETTRWPALVTTERAAIRRTGVFGFVFGISLHDRGALTIDHGYTNFDVETRNRL